MSNSLVPIVKRILILTIDILPEGLVIDERIIFPCDCSTQSMLNAACVNHSLLRGQKVDRKIRIEKLSFDRVSSEMKSNGVSISAKDSKTKRDSF